MGLNPCSFNKEGVGGYALPSPSFLKSIFFKFIAILSLYRKNGYTTEHFTVVRSVVYSYHLKFIYHAFGGDYWSDDVSYFELGHTRISL